MNQDKKSFHYFAANLRLLRKRRKKTQEEIAQSLNLTRSTINNYENSIADPNFNSLIAFSQYFNISIDTLLKVDMGKLSEFQLSELDRGFDVFVSGAKIRILTATVDRENKDNIELVNHKAKAGYAAGFADPEYIKELPMFQLPFLSKEKKYRSFQISGDSMIPFPENAYITGEYLVNWNELKTGDLCIIITYEDGILFKMIQNNLHEDGTLKLISLNQAYLEFSIHAEQINEIWKFTNFISNQIPSTSNNSDDLHEYLQRIESEIKKINLKLNKNDE